MNNIMLKYLLAYLLLPAFFSPFLLEAQLDLAQLFAGIVLIVTAGSLHLRLLSFLLKNQIF
jgi:hypothetical protein